MDSKTEIAQEIPFIWPLPTGKNDFSSVHKVFVRQLEDFLIYLVAGRPDKQNMFQSVLNFMVNKFLLCWSPRTTCKWSVATVLFYVSLFSAAIEGLQ